MNPANQRNVRFQLSPEYVLNMARTAVGIADKPKPNKNDVLTLLTSDAIASVQDMMAIFRWYSLIATHVSDE